MSEPTKPSQDEEHLRLLKIFHYVCAALAAAFSCIFIIHLVIGLIVLLAPHAFGPAKGQPPAFFGLFFVMIGGGLMTAGWTFAALLAWAGRCLGRREHYTFCFVMACVACLFQPFGTVLGVFTIVVLVRPSVKALFGQPAAPA
jgi:hypothetical protein